MRHGSLFSGIGGFDLASECMGWTNVFHCEFKEFNQNVLKYYWPKAITYGDIKQTDFTIHRGSIDILTGGFPCQPYSLAGKRKGKEDDRHLWPEMLRAVREIKPKWVVGENVYGLVNWSGGLVFNEVQADLEAEGYEVQPVILPACGINAPHKRDRVWFIAYSGITRQSCRQESDGENPRLKEIQQRTNRPIGKRTSANSYEFNGDGSGLCSGKIPQYQTPGIFKNSTTYANSEHSPLSIQQWGQGEKNINSSWEDNERDWFKSFPTVSPVCNGNDGLSSGLDFEALFKGVKPRKGTAFGKWRRHSIEAGGNAIVPQVAYEIFKAIEETEKL